MSTDDTTPGGPRPTPDLGLVPPLPPDPAAEETKPSSSRPTTRAGRRAAAEARKASGAKDAKPKSSTKAPRRASLETRLTGSLVSLGTVVAAGGAMASPALQLDGVAIIQHAPGIAAALDKVAKDDPKVAAALERMLTAGVWSGLIAATLPLVLVIAANHGAIPPQIAAMLGAEVPDPIDHGQHGQPDAGQVPPYGAGL